MAMFPLQYGQPTLADRFELAQPQSEQLKTYAFTVNAWAMKDPIPDHEPFDLITAKNYENGYVFHHVIQNVTEENELGPKELCKKSIYYTEEELLLPKEGSLTTRYMVVGYIPYETLVDERHLRTRARGQQRVGMEEPYDLPFSKHYKVDEGKTPFLVVLDLGFLPKLRLHALMRPEDGLCTPYHITQERKLAIFWRWEFRSGGSTRKQRYEETETIAVNVATILAPPGFVPILPPPKRSPSPDADDGEAADPGEEDLDGEGSEEEIYSEDDMHEALDGDGDEREIEDLEDEMHQALAGEDIKSEDQDLEDEMHQVLEIVTISSDNSRESTPELSSSSFSYSIPDIEPVPKLTVKQEPEGERKSPIPGSWDWYVVIDSRIKKTRQTKAVALASISSALQNSDIQVKPKSGTREQVEAKVPGSFPASPPLLPSSSRLTPNSTIKQEHEAKPTSSSPTTSRFSSLDDEFPTESIIKSSRSPKIATPDISPSSEVNAQMQSGVRLFRRNEQGEPKDSIPRYLHGSASAPTVPTPTSVQKTSISTQTDSPSPSRPATSLTSQSTQTTSPLLSLSQIGSTQTNPPSPPPETSSSSSTQTDPPFKIPLKLLHNLSVLPTTDLPPDLAARRLVLYEAEKEFLRREQRLRTAEKDLEEREKRLRRVLRDIAGIGEGFGVYQKGVEDATSQQETVGEEGKLKRKESVIEDRESQERPVKKPRSEDRMVGQKILGRARQTAEFQAIRQALQSEKMGSMDGAVEEKGKGMPTKSGGAEKSVAQGKYQAVLVGRKGADGKMSFFESLRWMIL